MTPFEPMRTALFVPGNREDRVDKAVRTGADAVIIDLEDAVPLALKAETRPKVRQKIQEHGDRRMIVRVNGLGSGFMPEDLDAVAVKQLGYILIPKVEAPEDIHEINRRLLTAEKNNGVEPGTIPILVQIESARGVQNVFRIVAEKTAPNRVFTAAFGAMDYTLDLGIEMTGGGAELAYARARIPVACRAAGVEPPLDTPFMLDLRDIEALKADARRAKALGFQGKLCIHPNQIEPCHEIFSPTREEIEHAQRVVEAFKEAEAAGAAAIQMDGKFIDYAVVERSRRVLQLAERTAGRAPTQTD